MLSPSRNQSFCCLLVLCIWTSLSGITNLENGIQQFVLESREVIIPECPGAFNPSIVRWNNSLLMSFRYISGMQPKSTGELQGYASQIGLVWLDDNFDPIDDPQLLDLSVPGQKAAGREEDGRLIVVGEHLYLIYSDNKEANFSDGGFRTHMVELIHDGCRFDCINHESFTVFEGESQRRREKNWTPFDLDGELHFAYTINPHIVFKPVPGTQSCLTIAKSYARLPWQWGDPRGGTPALRVNEQEYLSFFHSLKNMSTVHSDNGYIDHYLMGAYTFSASYPHQMTAISPEPIVGPNFYDGRSYPFYWRPVVVVFPCGYIHDDNYVWVSFGRQDHEMWVVKIDKNALLKSLVSVSKVF